MVLAVFLSTYLPSRCVHICCPFVEGLLVFLLSSKIPVCILDTSLLSNTQFSSMCVACLFVQFFIFIFILKSKCFDEVQFINFFFYRLCFLCPF